VAKRYAGGRDAIGVALELGVASKPADITPTGDGVADRLVLAMAKDGPK